MAGEKGVVGMGDRVIPCVSFFRLIMQISVGFFCGFFFFFFGKKRYRVDRFVVMAWLANFQIIIIIFFLKWVRVIPLGEKGIGVQWCTSAKCCGVGGEEVENGF